MTLRELMQEQRSAHVRQPLISGLQCAACWETWPCSDYDRAVAALAILDDAERPNLQNLPVPGYCSCDAPRVDCCTCDQGYALVRDPEASHDDTCTCETCYPDWGKA